jgi:hypothetical protein
MSGINKQLNAEAAYFWCIKLVFAVQSRTDSKTNRLSELDFANFESLGHCFSAIRGLDKGQSFFLCDGTKMYLFREEISNFLRVFSIHTACKLVAILGGVQDILYVEKELFKGILFK